MRRSYCLNGPLAVFALPQSQELAEKTCGILGQPLGNLSSKTFSDGEKWCQFKENIRGRDVFLIGSTFSPDDNWMRLFIAIDAAKRSSARRINVVMAYMGYARQERKDKPRVPITSKLLIDILICSGATRIMGVDIHSAAAQGFTNAPFDHLYGHDTVLKEVTGFFADNAITNDMVVAVSPDLGAITTVRSIASRYGWGIASIDKNRVDHNQVGDGLGILGIDRVKNKICLILDDMVDTAGTLSKGVNALSIAGAQKVFAAIVHPVLSGNAIQNIGDSKIDKMWVSDSIPLNDDARLCDKIEVVTLAGLLANAISRVHNDESISDLFPDRQR